MIRFIISDVDGTILLNGDIRVSDRLIEQIQQLKEKGVLFAVASGRNYNELTHLFPGVGNDILYITNNGAVVIFDQEIVCKETIERRVALDIIKDAQTFQGCHILVTGEKESYISSNDNAFCSYMKNQLNYNSIEIDDFYKIKEDMAKVSIRQPGGVTQEKLDYLYNKWGDKVQIVVSGTEWIDMMAPYVTKGNAIAMVQHLYNISVEDTMTFGDSYNDIDMFERSYFSYAMQNANPEIKKAAKHIASDVETIIDDVIRM